MKKSLFVSSALNGFGARLRALGAVVLMAGVLTLGGVANAQLSGKGAVSGTVFDSTGAAVPGATVTITNDATKIATTTTSTSSGDYAVSTLDPGIYTVTITLAGFQKQTQKDVHVNALETQTYSPKLTVGSEGTEVTVTTAPPALETTNATLGATMEHEMYEALPIEMGAYGQADQRRATDFAFLMPGVQGNNTTGNPTTNTGIVNGSGSRGAVSAVYIDGLPFVRAGGNGDPRFVWTAISVDAVDQFQVQTSGYSATLEGQGVQNYTIKSGGVKYHGSIYEFFRNTALDTYGFFGSVPNAAGVVHKPVEHQNEYGINLSGPLVPFGSWKTKLFFFGNYNGYRYSAETPTQNTFPTLAQQQGNFAGVVTGGIYDPNTQATCTSFNTGGKPCRYRYGYQHGTGVGTNGNPILIGAGAPVDQIPAAQLSAVALKMQSYIPALTNQNLQNNFLSQNRNALSNFSTTDRIDWNIGKRDTLTMIAAIGRQSSSNPAGQSTAGRNVGPVPYNYGQAFAPKTAVGIIEETHIFTDHLVNQLKYGYARYNGPTFDANQVAPYAATAQGISGTPAGAASNAFPIVTFAGTNAPTGWGGTTPNVVLAENYSLLDNLQWVKGKHTLTVGGQTAWLLYNQIPATGNTTPLTLAEAVTETQGLNNAFTAIANTGVAYASFLIGQNDKASFTQYIQSEFGARFRAISPYVQDNWKIFPTVTLDLGIRYDFFPTYTEVHNAGSYFSPTLVNPVTGIGGALQFTGSGPGTCNCQTPASNFYKNIGPRLGLAWQVRPNTVVRASYGVMYTHGNAVGGSAFALGGANLAQGTLGFSGGLSASANGSLLSTAPFTGTNGALPGYATPTGVASGPQFGTGYTNTAGYTGTPQTVGYPDPYLGGRAPQFINYTLGIQQALSQNLTLTLSYVGSQGHFLPTDGGNARGFFSDQLDPKYLNLGTRLADTGTTTTTVAQDCVTYSLACPANFNTGQPLSQALKPFPFYAVNDAFGYVGNSNYHSLQTSLNMKSFHGLTFMANYTWSHAIDDGGTFRTGYAIPAGAIANRPNASYAADRIERGSSTSNQPHHLVVTGVWALPLGKEFLGKNALERAIFGGFKFSEIFQAFSGSPLAITGSTCQTNPAQITCEPTLNPNFSGSARVNGKWGQGITAANTSALSYIAQSTCSTTTAATGPFISPTAPTGQVSCLNTPAAPAYTFGNAPRTGAYGLTGPGNYNLDIALVRSFPLHFSENARFNFRAEWYNVTNHTFFAVASTAVGNASFGQVTNNAAATRKSVQLSARIEF